MIALQALRNVMPYDFEVVSKLYNDFYILLRLNTRPLVGLEASYPIFTSLKMSFLGKKWCKTLHFSSKIVRAPNVPRACPATIFQKEYYKTCLQNASLLL